MSVTQSIYIDAPVAKVFDFCLDPRKSWSVGPDQMLRHGSLTDVKTTEEGVGTYYSWSFRLAGVSMEGFDVVTECVPNERITDRSSRPFVGTWTSTFEPEGTGTRLTMQRQPASSPAMRLADRLFDRFRISLGQQTMAKLKAELEKASAPAGSPTAP